MNNEIRERYLKRALVVSGIAFLLVYPLGFVWPTGWVWHGGQGSYYLQMISGVYAVLGIFLIAAAKNPAENRSLISFTIWSSVVHAAIMAVQALYDGNEHGHLVGDVPALLLVAGVLWFLSPTNQVASRAAG
jgi:hypothetical protein